VLGEPLEIGPAQLPRERKCRSEDGPAIVRISFDDFALPSRIEQIGESRRRVLGLDQIGVVTNWAERGERTISMTRPSQHLKWRFQRVVQGSKILSGNRSWAGCTIDTPGFNFRKRQVSANVP
jgi:hypothetical protein